MVNKTKVEKEKLRKERERMKNELIPKWTAWALVTQNCIIGNFMNDLDEEEIWEKLLELPPERKGWIDAEEHQPDPWEPVLCWCEYYSFKRNRMRQNYAIGCWTGERWSGEAAQGHRAKVLFWTTLPVKPKKKRRKHSENTQRRESKSQTQADRLFVHTLRLRI